MKKLILILITMFMTFTLILHAEEITEENNTENGHKPYYHRISFMNL